MTGTTTCVHDVDADIELIKAMVPEADTMDYADALALAVARDRERAYQLEQDCLDNIRFGITSKGMRLLTQLAI